MFPSQVEPYSTTDDDLSNQFVHLVNNSIGKHSEHFERVILEEVTGREIRGFMLTSDDFAEYLRISTGEDLFHTQIQPQMKNIARWASMCAVDGVEHRKNSWELFGYDFMIDSHFKVGGILPTMVFLRAFLVVASRWRCTLYHWYSLGLSRSIAAQPVTTARR